MSAGIVSDKGNLHTPLSEGVEGLDRSRERLVPAVQYPIHIHGHMCDHLPILPWVPQSTGHSSTSAGPGLTLPLGQTSALYTVSCCMAIPVFQYSRRGSRSRGRASLTVSGRSWRLAPCRAAMAALASSALGISTNPKPRERPVYRSVIRWT